MAKLSEKVRLQILNDIELSKNYMAEHKWVKQTEFIVTEQKVVTSACAIGAIRGAVYNGSLKLNMKDPSIAPNGQFCVAHDIRKTNKTLEARYNNIEAIMNIMTTIRTKGVYNEVYDYNDNIASRKRDILTLFDNAKKAVITGQIEMVNGVPKAAGKLEKKVNQLTSTDTVPNTGAIEYEDDAFYGWFNDDY